MMQPINILGRLNHDTGSSDESSSRASNTCDTLSVMKKIEDCNRGVLELVDVQEALLFNNVDELSRQLAALQNKLYEATSTIERSEARRQASEYELAFSMKTNGKLHEICSKQYQLLQDSKTSVEETNRRCKELIQQTVTHWNGLNVEWQMQRSSLEEKVQRLSEEKTILHEELRTSQLEGASLKEINGELQKKCALLAQQLEQETANSSALKVDLEKSFEKKSNELLKDNQQLKKQLESYQKQIDELCKQQADAMLHYDGFTRSLRNLNTLFKHKVTNVLDRLRALEGRLSNESGRINHCRTVRQRNKLQVKSLGTCQTEPSSGKSCLVKDTASSHGDHKVQSCGQILRDAHVEKLYNQLIRLSKMLQRHLPPTEAPDSKGSTEKLKPNKSRRRIFLVPATVNRESPHGSNAGRDKQASWDWDTVDKLFTKVVHDLDQYFELHERKAVRRSSIEQHHRRHHHHDVPDSHFTVRPDEFDCSVSSDQLKNSKPCYECMKQLDGWRNRSQLSIRLQKAMHEISRWRRRWKQQQITLYMERQRLSALKETQQTDRKMKKKFLNSVCQLIQEASRQIDRVVYKHIRRLATSAPTEQPVHVASAPEGTPSRHIVESSAASDQPTARSRHSQVTKAHSSGDNPAAPCGTPSPQQAAWGVDEPDALLHTNCNNNVGLSRSSTNTQLNEPSYYANTAASVIISGSYMWSDNTTLDTDQLVPNKGPTRHDSFDDLEDCRSAADSVSTTSDPFESYYEDQANPQQMRYVQPSDGRTDPVNLTLVTDEDSEGHLAHRSICGAMSNIPKQKEMEARQWLEFRSAVRFELGRVMGSVVNHAKQDDSLAKECLDAIVDIQNRLFNEIPVSPANSDQLASPKVPGQGTATVCRHPSNLVCLTRTQSSISNKRIPSPLSTVQVSRPNFALTSPSPQFPLEVDRISAEATRHSLDDSPNSGAPTDQKPVHPTSRPTGCLKRAELKQPPRERWKPVGGVIHRSIFRDLSALHPRCGAKPQQQTSADQSREGKLPVIANRRVMQSSGFKKSSTETANVDQESKQFRASSNTAATPCVLPSLTSSQGSYGTDSSRHRHCCMKQDLAEPCPLSTPKSTSIKSRYAQWASKPSVGKITTDPLEPIRSKDTKSQQPVSTPPRKTTLSAMGESNNNTSPPPSTSPSAVQWIEVEEPEISCALSPRSDQLPQGNNCCCGTPCCIVRPPGSC